ncbi:replication protein [bacterium]|nr:replication protein [bacterium]
MESLQVGKPLRLSTRAPVFAAPQASVENATQVINPTVDKNTTEVENQTPVVIPTQVARTTWVKNQTEVQDQTLVTVQTQVPKQTTVENTTLVSNPTEVKDTTKVGSAIPSRRATEQDSSVVLEARAVDGLEKGYTRLPNNVLMRMASSDFTRNEMKLALLIARFTISFQRRTAPLSKTVLERRSRLRGPAVLEALAGLVRKGLITKQQGDQNRPNVLGLVLPENWDELTKTPRDLDTENSVKKQSQVRNETQVTKATTVTEPTPVASHTPAEVVKPTGAEVGNPTYIKDIEIYSKKNSLSSLPEKLREYFNELKPAKKRESEWKAFRELSGEYPLEDIAECFTVVSAKGVGGIDGAERCHSPMAFLTKAIGEVLQEVERTRVKVHERELREQRELQAKRLGLETEAREAAEWAAKERAFKRAFPSEDRQQEVLAELCRGLPFRRNTVSGRIFAIGKWWDSLSQYERMEFLE